MTEELKNLEITDAKDRISARKEEEAELLRWEKLLQTGKSNPYGTTDKKVFAAKVESMGIDDLRTLAVRVGVQPINRQSQLRKYLLDNFDDYIRRSRANIPSQAKTSVPEDSDAYASIRHLLP